MPPGHSQIALSINNLAYLYQVQGRSREAEPMHKRALAIWEKALPPGHPQLAWSLVNLGITYVEQGRLDEAELLQKRALEIREKAFSSGHPDVAKSLALLANIYEKQRRLPEAEGLHKRALAILEASLPAGHPDIAITLNNLAIVYDVQGRLPEAEAAYKRALDMREKGLPPGHPEIAANLGNLGIVYRRQGRMADANRVIQRALELQEKALPPGHLDIARTLGNLAVLKMTTDDWAAAHGLLLRQTDMLITRSRRDSEVFGGTADRSSGSAAADIKHASIGFHSLVKVAYRLAAQDRAKSAELGNSSFVRAQWAATSEAAASLAQMSARSAKTDSKLAGLVRERQDLAGEWQVRDKQLLAISMVPRERRNATAEGELRSRLTAIDRRLGEIDQTLAKEFPDYAALASPEPLTIADVQQLLRPQEALVLLLDTEHQSASLPEEAFIWVVTKSAVRWLRAETGGKALADRVAGLRCGLDASQWADEKQAVRCRRLVEATPAAGLLPFDLFKAYDLYRSLFGQVEDLLEGKQLLILPSGPLSALPFQALVTEKPAAAFAVSSADYAKAAWLAKRNAVTILPSIASLRALRQFAKASKAAEPFIGFGNPLLLGPDRSDRSAWERQSCAAMPTPQRVASRGKPGAITKLGRSGLANVEEIRAQQPLPETADELCAVARLTGAAEQAVFLGARASEKLVRSLSAEGRLANAKIIHFATYGLLAGETEMIAASRAEPALILSPPETAAETDDGLLTASEITQLKLDADWVVLSACNTAAGGSDRPSAEALSGLARAFFYAGARALLVSHWAVNSDATVKLITRTFDALNADPRMTRAEALRRSMVALADGGSDAAHPAYWAPFVVVGEGGRGTMACVG